MLAAHIERGIRPQGWLFVGAGDGPPGRNNVWYQWDKTTTAAEVEGVRLHDLRHFYASGLIAAGCDVVTVQRALGHSSAATTLSTYSHLWPTAEDRIGKASEAMLRAAVRDHPADYLRTETALHGP
jgi:integrase